MTVVCFDLDDTLIHEGFDPPVVCTDAPSVVRSLHAKGYTLILTSYNTDAERLLTAIGLRAEFITIIAYEDDWTAKASMWEQVRTQYPDAIIWLFDDLPVNITCAAKYGIKGILVDYATGVTTKAASILLP